MREPAKPNAGGKRQTANRFPLRLLLILTVGGWAALGSSGCGQNALRDAELEQRSTNKWATPLDRPGLGNLHCVSDDLYRGQQPERAGFDQLKAIGVKTVVDLRSSHSDQAETAKAGLDYINFPMEPYRQPDDGHVVAFLRVVSDRERAPVFVHCQFGADRTGVMCAAYRVVVQHWDKQDAIDEMKHGGFHWNGFAVLERYIQNLDVAAMRQQVAATQPEEISFQQPAISDKR